MQPTNTVVVSETSEQGGAQSVDDFMGMDDFMDDSPEEVAVVNATANQPFFLTPEIQFGFKMGEAAYFQVVGVLRLRLMQDKCSQSRWLILMRQQWLLK